MPGRFLETDNKEVLAKFFQWLKLSSSQILVYAYGDWLEEYDGLKNILNLTGFDIIKKSKTDSVAIVKKREM